ncbi:hypothetical protein [Corynebacterium mayonis]|uniref:hypothetical protein n=1 Tax=Corynebacterium mayonis TaxID=3062461 RepID=UPI003140AE7E
MKTTRLFSAAALAAALTVAGCSAEKRGETWQIVALYTDPNTPGALPADAAGKAYFIMGGQEVKGFTGCTPLRATIDAREERIRLETVEYGATDEGCSGGTELVDATLKQLLTPDAEFVLRHMSDNEMLLTAASDAINPPSIRLMSL